MKLHIITAFALLSITLLSNCNKEQSSDFPYLNPELSFEERVDDLVGRMTLEEKVGQMISEAPAIERLGIPEYNWWNEGLHGMARAGRATVFPQAIGLGAMWDENEMLDVATAIANETRAKHHDFVRKGKRSLYQGLTLWSPNINIFRDPRWGRGQETYGEDPYLTGRMAINFVNGLQGNDPKYYKTIATVKHFAVHNGPEPERHIFNAETNDRDLWETYLPQFEMAIKEANVYSAMCAYNRYNGEACCGSHSLMNEILRNKMGFDGYIVSDCGAIEDIYNDHKIVGTPEEAAALAVQSGCDLNCGLDTPVFPYLLQAVEKGLITEEQVDVSVKRLFLARFKLGMFDPEEMVEYAQTPYETVDNKKHQDLAVSSASKSMVLLKNENNLLPLSKELKNVAVIGPNSNQWLMLLGNYNGVPSNPVTPLQGIQSMLPDANVTFAQGCELADGMPMFYTIPSEVLKTANGETGVLASYYNNRDLAGEVVYSETVKLLDANWYDTAPRDDLDDDDFGVVWETTLTPTMTGKYALGFISTCSTKMYLDDELIAETSYHFKDEYGDPRLDKSELIHLEAGKSYSFRVQAGESYADAQVQLVWAAPKPNLKAEAIKAAKDAEVVVMCMGLTARMEGEEMDIVIDGFRGGDRTKLGLPAVQLDLIKEIHALGKPIVLVLLNGSAMAINWENENIPAILEAWYPGQAGGTAIANILFGEYNPAGRLPVTFYKSADDLPPFEQYAMTGHTYKYFTGEPLYPFGYGLSYTTFEYSDFSLPEESQAGNPLELSATVTNTGSLKGEEVVQLYISNKATSDPVPIRTLRGFKRLSLNPGESKTVTFILDEQDFYTVLEDGSRVVKSGEYSISIGGGQPDVSPQSSNILTSTIVITN